MTLVNVDEEIYAWMSRVFVILVLFLSIITIIWHIFCVNRELKAQETEWSYLLACTFMLQFIIMICLGALLYASFFSFANSLSCTFAVYSPSSTYILSKSALYMVLSFRIDISFRGTAFEYSKHTLNIWRLFLGLATILEMFVLWLTASVDIIDDDIEKENSITIPCKIDTIDALSSTVVCVDCIASFVNLYMFVNPLKQAGKAVESRKNIFDIANNNKSNNNRSKMNLHMQKIGKSLRTGIGNIIATSGNMDPDYDNGNVNNNITAIVPVGSVSPSSTFKTDNEIGNYSIAMGNEKSNSHVHPNELEMQHISLASGKSSINIKDSKQLKTTKSTTSLSSSSSKKTIKRSSSLQKKNKKFLDIIRKTTILTMIAVTGTILSMLLVYFIGITPVWYVSIYRIYIYIYF